MTKALIVFAAGLVLTPLFFYLWLSHGDLVFGGGWWGVFGVLGALAFFVALAAGFVALVIGGWHVSDYIGDRRLRRVRKRLENDELR